MVEVQDYGNSTSHAKIMKLSLALSIKFNQQPVVSSA